MTRDPKKPSHFGKTDSGRQETGANGNGPGTPPVKPRAAPAAKPRSIPMAKPSPKPASPAARPASAPPPAAHRPASRPPAAPKAAPSAKPRGKPPVAPATNPRANKPVPPRPTAPMAAPRYEAASATHSKLIDVEPVVHGRTPKPSRTPLPPPSSPARSQGQSGQAKSQKPSQNSPRPHQQPAAAPTPDGNPSIKHADSRAKSSKAASPAHASATPQTADPYTPAQQSANTVNPGLAPDPLASGARHPTGQRNKDTQPPKLERHYLPTDAPRPRASLHEKSKAPSIGGLIHSMQAKPSKTPYYTAAITSVVWLFIGGLLGWLLVGQSLSDFSGYKAVLSTSSVYILAAAILVPMALFWFIAQLVVRSHEMKLMASTMTEVAIRLAEPNKMAEQKVASVGQTIRRQVSAMDDAISRAIGRAGELEALVHNEVAALERSYTQNEFIIRNLLNELVNEREAIAHNGLLVKQTLQGVGAQVSQNIQLATDGIGQNLAQHGTLSALKLQQAGDQVTTALKTTSDQTVAIKQKISAELPQLLTKMNQEQLKLGTIIDGASKNLGQLDTTLAQRTSDLDEKLSERTSDIDGMITKHTGELNTRLVQKVKALDASLAMRTKSMDKTLISKADDLNKTFLTHRDAIDETMQKKAVEIDQAISSQAQAMDASLTQKARTIDAAFDQRLASLEDITPNVSQPANRDRAAPISATPPPPTAPAKPDLSMLRGSEALERAMTSQTENLQANLESNRNNLNQTIDQQNQLSPKITELSKKHDQLLSDHSRQIKRIREQFAAQSADLSATARLLTSPDMKMSAMMGPQQNKARAILGDIVQRSNELEKNRLAHQQTLQNSLMLSDETAESLKEQLAANASPKAQKAAQDVDHGTAQSLFDTHKFIKEMEDSSTLLSQKIVEMVTSMSRSTSRTKILPGEVANTSTDVNKCVEIQLQALDALVQISGANIGSGLATATSSPDGRDKANMNQPTQAGRAPHGQGPLPPRGSGRTNSAPPPPPGARDHAGPTNKQASSKQPSQWSFGDLLARVADTDSEHEEQPLPSYRPASNTTPDNTIKSKKSGSALDPLDILRVDDIARALDSHTAAMAWKRYRSGERNVFTKGLYSSEGQMTFDQIAGRYHDDGSFRATVEKYVGDFEGLLKEADEKDPSGRIIQNYLTSDAGRAYLMLAHISGRLG